MDMGQPTDNWEFTVIKYYYIVFKVTNMIPTTWDRVHGVVGEMTGHNAGKPFKPIIRNVYSHPAL